MKNKQPNNLINSIDALANLSNYSLMSSLIRDPDATNTGDDYNPRQVFSGHYVPVKPTPINQPEYVAHSKQFFEELGFDDNMAQSDDFIRLFSGDMSHLPETMSNTGWATGYALSIYGTEYDQQCPFKTGNGYGDGRAISILEALINNQRWEMQLKGGGRTPYCRGADGRAVLRSSVREFLAQEHMHALGVPTSRSLSLYVSKTETVKRPWYSEGSTSHDPDRLISEPVAITTRVAPSFLRVGQLELFARRARNNTHPNAMVELEQIVLHLIDREYSDDIGQNLSTAVKALLLAKVFRQRLASLVANWIRVGYCQGNFNSDNCAAGGFTLDYGPFGFMDVYNPHYQPWTGGGDHFAFMNQPAAAEQNFKSFCSALETLLSDNQAALEQLNTIKDGFAEVMQTELQTMWASKLGLPQFNKELFQELEMLMVLTPVDFTRFFRELSKIPEDITPLKNTFYNNNADKNIALHLNYDMSVEDMDKRWSMWLEKWKQALLETGNYHQNISEQMLSVNPKYTLREWLVAPAYQQARQGDYSLIRHLQDVITQPYEEQSTAIEQTYYQQKPIDSFQIAGISHMSCSS